ncbi:hypothetical protein GCM10020229_05180 [Kitasatospora albolonga]|uniref:hypothetical protein n=1 Tax=Kitasatospora albolonga TaxID=68173 RepID=UPI0031F1AA13
MQQRAEGEQAERGGGQGGGECARDGQQECGGARCEERGQAPRERGDEPRASSGAQTAQVIAVPAGRRRR